MCLEKYLHINCWVMLLQCDLKWEISFIYFECLLEYDNSTYPILLRDIGPEFLSILYYKKKIGLELIPTYFYVVVLIAKLGLT